MFRYFERSNETYLNPEHVEKKLIVVSSIFHLIIRRVPNIKIMLQLYTVKGNQILSIIMVKYLLSGVHLSQT